MCKAMNRSLANVILGGYQTAAPKAGADAAVAEKLPHVEVDVPATAEALTMAKSVVIVPGYGLAVANAQYAIAELCALLKKEGVDVRFGIHPVAGRMPGQLNVLLAEAGVPYDVVFEVRHAPHTLPHCPKPLARSDLHYSSAMAQQSHRSRISSRYVVGRQATDFRAPVVGHSACLQQHMLFFETRASSSIISLRSLPTYYL